MSDTTTPPPVSNQLIPTVDQTPISYAGNREVIRELAERMMMQWPDAENLGRKTMIAAAQLAIAMNLNPFPHVGDLEIYEVGGHIVIDYKIDYLRRIARKVDQLHWTIQPRRMTPAEWRDHDLPPDCFPATATAARASEIAALVKLGCPWQEAVRSSTRTAIGIVFNDETFTRTGKPKPPPRGKTYQWVAEKRAEREIYRLLGMLQDNSQSLLISALTTANGEAWEPETPPAPPPFDFSALSDQQIQDDLFG